MTRQADIKAIIAEHSYTFEEYASLVRLHEEVAWQSNEYPHREPYNTDMIPIASFRDTEPVPTVSTIPVRGTSPAISTIPSPRAA